MTISMHHLNYVRNVLDEDEKEIKRKEATYRGSWKKRGGAGAFMMFARKWDRLEQMAADRGYDVFKDPGDGSDGTLIAEIRDLRRYLALYESEVLSRSTAELPIERKICRDALCGPDPEAILSETYVARPNPAKPPDILVLGAEERPGRGDHYVGD